MEGRNRFWIKNDGNPGKEALPVSRKACRIVPASLGELIGDYAAVSVGIKAYQDLYRNAERFSLKMTSTVS